ncbi:hypothetical protein D3C71_1285450 [compost metagenome]
MQAVERVKARQVDGLHDHVGFFGMFCADFFHPPGLDVQHLPGGMGIGKLVVHFRDGFAEVHGMGVRVDHQLLVGCGL